MMILPKPTGSRPSALLHHRRTNPKLSAAMAAVPNLDATIQMLDDLTESAKPVTPTASADAVTSYVHASLAEGKGLPDDMLGRYAEAEAAERTYILATEALTGLAGDLLQERDGLLHGGLNLMCSFLNDDLLKVYDAMRALLPVPTSAEQAIADGKVQAYKKFSTLRDEYRQIREAQRHLLASGLSQVDDELFRHLSKAWPIIAHAASLGAIWPDLPEWHKYGKKQVEGGRMVKLTPPWPDPDTEAFLDWLLTHPDAGPWVPTADQASALLNQIIKAAPTYYETTRSPDQEALSREYERRQRMWSRPAPHIVK